MTEIARSARNPAYGLVMIDPALPEGDRYLGFLFARGDTPAEVERSLRAAHACLEIVID